MKMEIDGINSTVVLFVPSSEHIHEKQCLKEAGEQVSASLPGGVAHQLRKVDFTEPYRDVHQVPVAEQL